MRESTIFIVLSILFLSVLVTPMPSNKPRDAGSHIGIGAWNNITEDDCGVGYNKTVSVQVSPSIFSSGEQCGRWVRIENIANGLGTTGYGKIGYGQIGGICLNCRDTDLVMTTDLFAELANLTTGVVNISWGIMLTPGAPGPICITNSDIACYQAAS
ncbi:hypothetical protein OG21DRAFT_1273794 [Imleria badia]|nr:hypothetical protein OG21DRAFT_1273794 [Imleria badia]